MVNCIVQPLCDVTIQPSLYFSIFMMSRSRRVRFFTTTFSRKRERHWQAVFAVRYDRIKWKLFFLGYLSRPVTGSCTSKHVKLQLQRKLFFINHVPELLFWLPQSRDSGFEFQLSPFCWEFACMLRVHPMSSHIDPRAVQKGTCPRSWAMTQDFTFSKSTF